MELIDSHCHLHNAEYFPGGAEEYLKRAQERGVKRVVVIGTSEADSGVAKDFAAQYAGVYWTFGVHPSEFEKPYTRPNFGASRAAQADAASKKRPIAIGEVGLDYHYGPEDYGGLQLSFDEMRARQWRLLEEMLELGIQNQLPFSFHVREAFDDFFGILANFPEVRGVIHSFSDNKKNLRRSLEYGFYIGVNGLATYSTLPQPPLERMLLETDAPFLAPVPHRGERCEPANIRDIAEWVARTYGISLEEVAKTSTQNFENLFFDAKL